MNPEILAGIVGVVLPPLVDFVNVKLGVEKSQLRFVLALLTSILVGVVATAIDLGGFGQFINNSDTLLSSIGATFTASQTIYNIYWKPSGSSTKLRKLL